MNNEVRNFEKNYMFSYAERMSGLLYEIEWKIGNGVRNISEYQARCFAARRS